MIDPTTVEAAAAALTVIGGLYTAVRRLVASSKRKKEEYREGILKEAKMEAERVRKALEIKIKELEDEFQTQKSSVSKDFQHFTAIYNSEIKVLGEKIENLREDLNQQHQALVGLLTKLVDR